ncbi:hypothetical protein LCGC14_1976170, partial [marine sediment metagenome]
YYNEVAGDLHISPSTEELTSIVSKEVK